MLTDDALLFDKGGCALPLLCTAVFLHLSNLCLVHLLGCIARHGLSSQASTRSSLCMVVLSVHLPCLQPLTSENKLKAYPPTDKQNIQPPNSVTLSVI